MKKEDIHLWDFKRILFGEAPVEFLIEVFVRTLIIYLILLITIRLMGKRMSGQLTIAEMAVMVTLGAIVSPAMQAPNVGLLQGILILALALALHRGFNLLEFNKYPLEKINHGEVQMVVRDGEILMDQLAKAKLSHQQLYAVLRNEGIFNLGEIERVYVESFGSFSIFKFDEARPGLSLLPAQDEDAHKIEKHDSHALATCKSCGHLADPQVVGPVCHVCGSSMWLEATVDL